VTALKTSLSDLWGIAIVDVVIERVSCMQSGLFVFSMDGCLNKFKLKSFVPVLTCFQVLLNAANEVEIALAVSFVSSRSPLLHPDLFVILSYRN
jgi:hypothetical protein